MTFMYNTTATYGNVTGAMPLLYSIRDAVPFAFQGLLLIIFFVLFGGQYFIIKNKTGRGKILTALLSSSIVMVILSSILALTQLITFLVVLFYAFAAIIIFALFLTSDYW